MEALAPIGFSPVAPPAETVETVSSMLYFPFDRRPMVPLSGWLRGGIASKQKTRVPFRGMILVVTSELADPRCELTPMGRPGWFLSHENFTLLELSRSSALYTEV